MLYLYESVSLQPILSFAAHSHSIFTAIADAQLYYSGRKDALLKIWDNPSVQAVSGEIKAHQGTINKACVFGDWLISAGRDKLLRVWQKMEDWLRIKAHLREAIFTPSIKHMAPPFTLLL